MQGAVAMMPCFQLRTLPSYDWPPLADGAIGQVWVAYSDAAAHAMAARRRSSAVSSHSSARCWLIASPGCPTIARCGKGEHRARAVRTLDDFRRLPLLPRRVYEERTAEFMRRELPAGTVATSTQIAVRSWQAGQRLS